MLVNMNETLNNFNFDSLLFLKENTEAAKKIIAIEYILRIMEADQLQSTTIYLQKILENKRLASLLPDDYLSTVLSWLALLSDESKTGAEKELRNMLKATQINNG